MKHLLQNRLLLQLLFTLVAAISVATLSVVLITEAIRGAESVVLGETTKTLATAIRELRQQYFYRASSDSTWQTLPIQARDVSLRGITQVVLRSYPGVEGGFYAGSDFLGYAYPTHDTGTVKVDVPSAERSLIISLAEQSLSTTQMVHKVVRGRADLLVLGALADRERHTVTWAMKRLVGREPGAGRREILLVVVVLAALISIAGTLATGLSLTRGIRQIKSGLSTLEQDFNFRLPERSDELGGISRSVNRMASVRRNLEREIRREDRLRAVGQLAAGLAHEIRNPLNSIRLTVQLLERRSGTNSIRREDLQPVRIEVDRLNNLLTDLLELQGSRPPIPKVQPVLPILQHCVTLIKQQAEMQNTNVCLERADPALCASFDAPQLTQTVMNLLLNAMEASAGGIIRLRVLEEKNNLRIEVQDSGPGLDDEQREHLFEPFYTTKPAGTGLGLAVSRELMRGQGGNLTYVPNGAGACFVVELPRG